MEPFLSIGSSALSGVDLAHSSVAFFALEGEAELVGPGAVTAEGGMCGTYVRTLGRAGTARLRIQGPGLEDETVDFTIEL